MKATTMLPITYTVGTEVMDRMSTTSGIMSKKETEISAPAANAKKYLTGILVLFSVNTPPSMVEKKVTATKNSEMID